MDTMKFIQNKLKIKLNGDVKYINQYLKIKRK